MLNNNLCQRQTVKVVEAETGNKSLSGLTSISSRQTLKIVMWKSGHEGCEGFTV